MYAGQLIRYIDWFILGRDIETEISNCLPSPLIQCPIGCQQDLEKGKTTLSVKPSWCIPDVITAKKYTYNILNCFASIMFLEISLQNTEDYKVHQCLKIFDLIRFPVMTHSQKRWIVHKFERCSLNNDVTEIFPVISVKTSHYLFKS